MRIVITGRSGQVARSLAERGPLRGRETILIGRPELDLSGSSDKIAAALESERPDVIVSAAAYTAVDRAEAEPEIAFAINEAAAVAIARAARKLSVPLLHLSTDYVFDGLKQEPYVENDLTHPQTVYGASKLAGEKAVLAEHGNSAILRTAWVYSPFGSNFVKTMLRLASERDEVRVVADQLGNPTSALDIADAILTVAANLLEGSESDQCGIFHLAGSGEASWAEFAEAIFAISASNGGPSALVRSISTAQYPTPARRPANSRLDCSKLERVHKITLPDWRKSVERVIYRLTHQGA